MQWSGITLRLGLVVTVGLGAISLPAEAQQEGVPAATVTAEEAHAPALATPPAGSRILVPVSVVPNGAPPTTDPIGDIPPAGPRIRQDMLPVGQTLFDSRDGAGIALPDDNHTIVLSTLGLILVVAILAILIIK